MAHGDVREGKWRGNWRMECVASTLHTTSEHDVSSITTITTADAYTSAASSRLNWSPRRFKWTRQFRRKTKSGFCACAITFQTQSNTSVLAMGFPFLSICNSIFIQSCLYNQCISRYGKVLSVHKLKANEGRGSVNPRILNLCIRCMWAVHFILNRFSPKEIHTGTSCIGGWVEAINGAHVLKENLSPLIIIEPRFLGCKDRSPISIPTK
jgi:hypothetical protein